MHKNMHFKNLSEIIKLMNIYLINHIQVVLDFLIQRVIRMFEKLVVRVFTGVYQVGYIPRLMPVLRNLITHFYFS